MLLILLSWLCCFTLSYIFGAIAQEMLSRLCKNQICKNQIRWSILLTTIAGLSVVSSIAAALTIFLPVDLPLQGLVVAIAGLGIFIFKPPLIAPLRDDWQGIQALPRAARIGLIAIACYLGLLLCFRSVIGLFGYDTGYYHAPSIQWIERFPAVAGLGNFFGPLANNSIWFITLALFDLAPRSDVPTHGIGFLLLGLAIVTAISRSLTNGILSPQPKFTAIFWITSLLPLVCLYNSYASYTTSTDLPASVLVLLLIGCFLEYVAQEQSQQDTVSWTFLLVVITPFAIAIKLSTAPLFLLGSWAAYREYRKNGLAFLGIATGLFSLLFAPQIIRNIILSGYLVYPFPSIDLFSVDWKIPLAQAISEKRSIEGWSRFPTVDPEKVLNGGFNFWFPTWFDGIPNHPDVRFIGFRNTLEGRSLVGSFLIFIGFLAISWRKFFHVVRPVAIAYLTGLIGVIFWFTSAPDLRFGYGFLWATIILLCLPALVQIHQLSLMRWALVLGIMALVIVAPIDRTQYWYSLFSRFDWNLQPMPYPDPPNRQWSVGDQTFFVSTEDDRCWHLFPCTPRPSPKLQLRGSSLSDGFRQ